MPKLRDPKYIRKIDCTFSIHPELLAELDAARNPEISRSQALCKIVREALDARKLKFAPKKPAAEALAA